MYGYYTLIKEIYILFYYHFIKKFDFINKDGKKK